MIRPTRKKTHPSISVWIFNHNRKKKKSEEAGCSTSPVGSASELSPADKNAIRVYLAQGRKLEAMKVYRDATGANLEEAKAAIEEFAKRVSI